MLVCGGSRHAESWAGLAADAGQGHRNGPAAAGVQAQEHRLDHRLVFGGDDLAPGLADQRAFRVSWQALGGADREGDLLIGADFEQQIRGGERKSEKPVRGHASITPARRSG
jgi:hypothetical protein